MAGAATAPRQNNCCFGKHVTPSKARLLNLTQALGDHSQLTIPIWARVENRQHAVNSFQAINTFSDWQQADKSKVKVQYLRGCRAYITKHDTVGRSPSMAGVQHRIHARLVEDRGAQALFLEELGVGFPGRRQAPGGAEADARQGLRPPDAWHAAAAGRAVGCQEALHVEPNAPAVLQLRFAGGRDEAVLRLQGGKQSYSLCFLHYLRWFKR